jgi:hypothetical protein
MTKTETQTMKTQYPAMLAMAMLCASSIGAAQTPPVPVFPTAPPPPYVSPETPQGSGRFSAVMEADSGLLTHTVYRPANLNSTGLGKLPVVSFGNGGCVNVGNRFRYFLTEIASHGFLVIATGPITTKEAESTSSSRSVRGAPAAGSPAALQVGPVPAGAIAPSDTTAAQLLDAVTWAIAENSRAGSKYQGRIDTAKVAVIGQSCGGIQAIDAAHDPRVSTLGVFNSGAFSADGGAWAMAAAKADKAALKTLHGSAIYLFGEPSDVAFNNAEDDFTRIDGIPLFHAWREKTGHTATYREPNGGEFGAVASAWLKWQLKGDLDAARMFAGADCGLCTRPDWHVKRKDIAPLAAGR